MMGKIVFRWAGGGVKLLAHKVGSADLRNQNGVPHEVGL